MRRTTTGGATRPRPPRRPLLADERREVVLRLLSETGAVRLSDLVERLGVSTMTVRRDLAQLDHDGQLRRVHGGALPVRLAAAAPSASSASTASTAPAAHRPDGVDRTARVAPPGRYEALAAAAVAHVTPGSCVGLAAGPVAPALAEALGDVPDLVVVTNSLPAADVLERAAGVSVILTGGVRTAAGALVGPVAVAALASLHLGEVLVAAEAIDHRAGITASTLLEAEVQRAMLRAAPVVRVVVPGHRIGRVALCGVAPASVVRAVVTDVEGAASGPVAALARVVEVVSVPPDGGERRTA